MSTFLLHRLFQWTGKLFCLKNYFYIAFLLRILLHCSTLFIKMRKILSYFKDFHKEYYRTTLYLTTFLFIAILITLNYTFDIEDSFIDRYYGKTIRILLYFAYHSLAYFGVLLIIFLFSKDKLHLSKNFWIKIFSEKL